MISSGNARRVYGVWAARRSGARHPRRQAQAPDHRHPHPSSARWSTRLD